MKAYIIYIATLLAALALPLAAQTGGNDTKAAPADPAMPYKLSLATTGGNNGTVTVEDNTPDGGGVTVAGNDTLVYGASGGTNATTVKLTVMPNNGYVVRTGYPKAYKTGVTGTTVSITGSSSPYTFKMPGYPVTVEVAYAHLLSKIGDITLKESKQTAEEVIAILPQYVSIVLANGHKDSLAVSAWNYDAADNNGNSNAHNNGNTDNNGAYNKAEGAVNVFRFTLAAALPDSIADANNLLTESDGNYTGKVKVANMAKPLVPTEDDKDKGITISGGTGDNLNSSTDDTSSPTPFDGTIGDGSGTKVKSIEVSGNVKDATLTLKGITVNGGTNGATDAKTEIKDGAEVTLKLEGSNTLGTLTVEKDASITLKLEAGATLNVTKIENAGTFIDSTATVTKVEGTGALHIKADVNGGGSVMQNTPVNLTASTNEKAGTTTFIWQKKNTDGSYTDVQTNSYNGDGSPITTRATSGITDTYQPATATIGSTAYRCLIKRTTSDNGNTATTLLSTKGETVTVTPKSDPIPDPDPDPIPPTYYTVTLPAIEGATTDPAAGNYEVESWDNFGFFLTLDKDYDQSTPVVTTSDGETITPRTSDGKYIIKYIRSDLTVHITGIVKNNPTANEDITAPGIRIWGSRGYLHVNQPTAGKVVLYTFGGALLQSAFLPAGDSQLAVPAGSYVGVAGGDNSFKVIIQ